MASANDARYGQKESTDQNFDYMFKILIIGNSSVGKTSFLFRYADDSFTPAFVSTVGIDFKVKTIYRNDKRIKLQIWVRSLSKASFNFHLIFLSAWVLSFDLRYISLILVKGCFINRNHKTFSFQLLYISGHCWAGKVQDHHHCILSWRYGFHSYVWHHQWGFL